MNKEQILNILKREDIPVGVFALYLNDPDQAEYMYCDYGYSRLTEEEFHKKMENLVNEEIRVTTSFFPEISIYSKEMIFQVQDSKSYFRVIGEDSSYGTTYDNKIDEVKPYEIMRVNYLTDKEYSKYEATKN